MKNILLLLSLGAILTSCLKEEIAISKPQKTNVNSYVTSLSLGPEYKTQLYYNLEKEEIILTADREAWDLAFETTADGYRILINNGRMGALKLLNTNDFAAITTNPNSEWGYDPASANLDSTFIGDWRNKDNIYLVDLGSNSLGASMGKYKLRILSVTETDYTIEYCKLNKTTPQQATISKEADYNFSLFNLRSGAQVTFANTPKKTEFDICLRTYTHIYEDGMPYLVVGCMLNDYKTAASMIHTSNFDDVSYEDALGLVYRSNVDAIGFEWKIYDFDESTYSIDPNKVFIIKTQNGNYFKIRFLDFYDEFGVKGSVKVEIQKLVG